MRSNTLLAVLVTLALASCGSPPKKSEPEPAPDRAQSGKSAPRPQTLIEAPEAEPVKAEILGKGAEGCTWVRSEALVTVGENDSRAQIRAAAVAKARESAMRDFLGVDVQSRFMDFQQEGLRSEAKLVESMLRTTRRGRILDEKILEEGYRDFPGCPGCRYRAQIKTCLLPVPSKADKNFHVELDISRSRLVEGDEAVLTVTATRSCFVYLYNVGMGGETALIVPNEIQEVVELEPGKPWSYPSEEQRKEGIQLIAAMPNEKVKASAETIRVIASKAALLSRQTDPSDGGYLGVLRRMHASKVEWADDALAFTIYKK